MRGLSLVFAALFVICCVCAPPVMAQEEQPPPISQELPPDPTSFDELQLVATATVTIDRLFLNRVTLEATTTAHVRNTAAEPIGELDPNPGDPGDTAQPFYISLEQLPDAAVAQNNDFNLDDGTPMYRVESPLSPGDVFDQFINIQLQGRARLVFAVRVYILAPVPDPDAPPPPPTVVQPQSPTSNAVAMFTGTTVPDAGTTVRITGDVPNNTPISVNVDGNGDFMANINLKPNKLNRFFFTTVLNNGAGPNSPATPVEVIQDQAPPNLFVDFPAEGETITTNDTTVTLGGRVGDFLSGFMGLTVTVDGQNAAVVIGIGTNGTWELSGLPLNLGANAYTVVAKDALGNEKTVVRNVTREAPTGATIQAFGGGGQTAQVFTELSQPLTVKVLQADQATPFANKVVTFTVVKSGGKISATSPIPDGAGQMVQVTTDANGEASVSYSLGGDAGCGNNRVRATAAGVQGEALFCASATAAPADRIAMSMGDGQIGETEGSAPEQLSAWVNDGCNGVPGVEVQFRVVQGNGKVDGVSLATVVSDATGHANVDFTFGPEPGTNVVEATFIGNQNQPAVFTMTGLARDPNVPTSFRTFVFDNLGQPIGGAECTLIVDGQTFVTDSDPDGLCEFNDIPSGSADFFVNGLEADLLNNQPIPLGSFPSLHFLPVIIPNVVNQLPQNVLLPESDPANARQVDNTQDVLLEVAGVDGFSMTIAAGSMKNPDGSIPSLANPATVSLNLVDPDKIPMPPPDNPQIFLAWTFQPAGATYDPPVSITYPNTAGHPPGTVVYFLSFDHDTNQFEIVATGAVTPDGLQAVSDPGSGITHGGWGGFCPPYPPPTEVGNCDVEITQPSFNPIYACPGDEVILGATGDPAGGEFNWDGGTPQGPTNGSLYTTIFPNEGTFTVIVTYTCEEGEADSDSCEVIVEKPSASMTYTVSKHPDLAGSVEDAVNQQKQLFEDGFALLCTDDDGPGDGGDEDDVCLTLTPTIKAASQGTFPDQSADTFPESERFDFTEAKYNDITSTLDKNNVKGASFSNVKVINSGRNTGATNNFTGSAVFNEGKLVMTQAANERTAVHEYGHNAGLLHRDPDDAIMYRSSNDHKNEVNRTERDAYKDFSPAVLGE